MEELTTKDLENMKNHKYKSTGYTTLDNWMNPFWYKCASFVPYKISPNMVTVSGLFCQFLSIIIIASYDLTFSEQLPVFVYIFSAFMIFMAQTLDAIDGKHARATNRTSPLGQLMDHGCDSMDNFLFCIVLSQAFLFGNSIHALSLQILIQIPFYTCSLEEHITGVIRTQINNMGVTEYQFFAMGLLITVGIFGNSFINFEIAGYKFSLICLYIILFIAISYCIGLIFINVKSLSEAFNKFKPMAIIISLACTELFSCNLYFYKEKPLLIIVLNGLYYSILTCKLIISNMAKTKIVILDRDLIIYIIGIFTCVIIGIPKVEFYILIGLFIWFLYSFYKQIINSIFKILDYLKISF